MRLPDARSGGRWARLIASRSPLLAATTPRNIKAQSPLRPDSRLASGVLSQVGAEVTTMAALRHGCRPEGGTAAERARTITRLDVAPISVRLSESFAISKGAVA